MKYQDLQDKVAELDFISGGDQADAAIKAVLGTMASRMDEPVARDFCQRLPDPLTYDKLRSPQQKGSLGIDVNQFLGQIRSQFKLDDSQSRRLIRTVAQHTRQAMGDQGFDQACRSLPQDWQGMLRS